MGLFVLLVLGGVLVKSVVVGSFAILSVPFLFGLVSRVFSLLMVVLGVLRLVPIPIFARSVLMA